MFLHGIIPIRERAGNQPFIPRYKSGRTLSPRFYIKFNLDLCFIGASIDGRAIYLYKAL